MPFQEGNQLGKANTGKDPKYFKNAIFRALKARDNGDDAKALERVATRLVKEAEQGNMAAIGILADRLDGKAQNQDDKTPNDPFMILRAEDVIDLIIKLGRSRNIALPSALQRIAAPEAGNLQTLREAEVIS